MTTNPTPNGREKIPVTISLIEKSQLEITDFEDIVNQITGGSSYTRQSLRRLYIRDRNVRIYFALEPKDVRWLAFMRNVLSPDSPMLKAKNRISSFVCFIESGDKIFTVTGGLGKFLVQDFLDQNFGMDILVRLIEKNAKSVRAIQDRGVTGTVLGESRFFRGKQSLADEDQFGRIYKELNAELNTRILTTDLGFSQAEVKRSNTGCWAKSSFLLGKSIGFGKMLTLVDRLRTILDDKTPNFSLNSVTLIRNRGDLNKELINSLLDALKQKFFQQCQQPDPPDFDFCHPDFEAYLSASNFLVEIDGEDDISGSEPFRLTDLIAAFKKKGRWQADTVGELDVGFLRRLLYSFDDSGTQLTRGTILEHLHGEITYNGNKFFYLDRQWYLINAAFVADLDKQCREMLKEYLRENLITERFDINRFENSFNDKFIGQKNCIVLDTILEENIEICDILLYDDRIIHLIHVKRGFNNSVRELAAQVAIAARRLAHDNFDNYTFVESIEANVRSHGKSTSPRLQKIARQPFPPGGLADLFRSRRLSEIRFTLAFVDLAKNSRHILNDIETFGSNMAKHSLLQLSRDVRKYGFEFEIVQLQKA